MSCLSDLRYALRAAWRDRSFSFIAVLTLGLGIGANTSLFTVVNAVLLAPLPLRNPERLVRVTVDFTRQRVSDVGLSIPELLDLRRSGLFDEVCGIWTISANPQPNDPNSGPYFTHDARVRFYRRVLDRVAALPGVETVGGVSTL